MCDCFHIAFPNWHAASSGAGAGRRLRGPEPGTEDNSICDEASQFTEGERPRPQGSSPVEEFPESDKYGDSDKECEAEHDPYQKRGKKPKKSGLGSIFDKRSTPKMSKLKEAPSPEAGVIVKTAKDGCAEGLVYSGGGKDGIFIKEVVPESPASKNLHLKEGDQVLSATVYFDNIPYEDAIQILEHAQAYKVKLCLKRKPEITETEGVIDSDAIPEDEVHPPEMREPGKKRRGDARISWPKFPTLGRGKKSRFTRSHSSSEADEQRKLELSPTTSDTESPIKSQDALKGKKKHKIKLPGLKRGRISSSEDTDAQNIQTEEMISPECLESPSRETQDLEDELKKHEKVENTETETQRVELVCLDTTLKTTDITAVLVEQETPSATASPDGKKKKKERSELKMKILGRDKKHKAKSSPKRLKTLGASLDKTDDKENEKSEAVPSGETKNVTTDADVQKMSSSKSSQMELRLPKVEIDISDVGIICKSTHDKKGKGTDEKQAKTGFKLPKVSLCDVPTEEIIKIDTSVEESKTKEKDDAYDRLSKGTELPKREDIEIPGMEDVSKITKNFKEPRAPLATISDAELQTETLQLSIDVDSVKEAVSKLPGYKLPKVDMSGVPIPEEITVIDANAQRISVKTPTKGKHESKSAFTEISKTTVKVPNVMADVSRLENISESKIGVKKLELESKDLTISTRAIISHTIEVEKVQKESMTFSSGSADTPKELDIKMKTPKATLPDLSISKPDIKIPDFKMDLTKLSEKKDDKIQGERTIFLPEDKCDVKLPDVTTSPVKGEFEISSKDITAMLMVQSEEHKDESVSVGGKETKSPEKHEKGGKFKMPNVGISMPKVKGGKVDVSEAVHAFVPEVELDKSKLEIKSQDAKLQSSEISLSKGNIDVSLPEAKTEVGVLKISESAGELEAQSGKFKLPKLGLKIPKMKGPELDVSISKKEIDVTLPDVKAKVDFPENDVTLGKIEGLIPEQQVDVKKTEIEVKAPYLEGDTEGKGGKFKMPKLGVKLPKVKGPEFDINLSKKDDEGTLQKGNVEVELPEAPDVSSPEKKIVKTEGEFDGQGVKFKMPKLGITMPKMKGPEMEFLKKDVEVTLPEVKADIKEPSAKIDVSAPEMGDIKLKADVDMDIGDPAIDAKAGKFKMPKFGISIPKVKGPEIDLSKKDKDVKPLGLKAEMKIPELDITVGKDDVPEAKIEIGKPSLQIKSMETKLDIQTPEVKSLEADSELEGQSGKYKIPRFTIAIPKVKGSETDSSSQKKDVDVALPEAKIEVELPKTPNVNVEVKPPEIDADLEGQGGKFKMPKFGIKMPKVKGPEIDISLPKKEVKSPEIKADIKLPEVPKVDVSFGELDVKIPDAKIEVPDLEVKSSSGKIKIKAPDMDVSVTEDSPSKFKMPSLGISLPKKDVQVTMPDAKAEVALPEVESKEISGRVDVKEPDVEASARGSPLKFKMPTFKLPKFGGSIEEKDSEVKIEGDDVIVTVPQADIDLPDVKAEIHLPETEVKAPLGEVVIEQPPGLELDAKFKKPRFSLPRFSFSKQSVPAPEADISAPEVNIPQTESKVEVKGEMDLKAPELEAQIDGQGSKFKLPKFGITMPKISAPEIDLSLSKKEVEVTLPEAKVEGKLPDLEVKAPSIEAEIKVPEIKAETKTKEGSPSKLKMPTFKLPKFGASIPEAEIKIEGTDIPKADVVLPEVKAEVNLPDVDVKAPSVELEIEQPSGLEMDAKFKKPRFSLPRFSFSKQSVPALEVDIGAPEVNIPHTEGKVEVKGEMDLKAPEAEAQIDGQGSKFKLPKFGITIPKISAPEIDLSLSKKDVEVTLPEAKVEGNLPDVKVKAPSIEAEIKVPEIKAETKTKEGSPSKLKMPTFKLPKFGASIPEAEIKIDGMEIPQTDVDLPDVKAEVHLHDVDVKAPSGELEIEQPSGLEMDAKFKKPRFSLPRFSFSKQSVPAPEVDIGAPEVNIPQTEGKVEVKGEMDLKAPELEAQIDGQGSKFKLPKFGITMPKISAPEIDLSLSKKDVEVTLPEAKVEGKLPDVEVKAPSIEAEIKAPEIKVETKTKEGSPSKLKMPTFKLPKFGTSIPETEIKVDGAEVTVPRIDVNLPEVKAEVNPPEAEIKASSGEIIVEQPSGLELDAKFKKPRFSLPRFSFSKPSVPAPEVDISGPEVNIPQTEGKVEVKGEMDLKAPELEAQIDGQGSKFKLPKFGITMPKISAPDIDLSLSKKDVEVTLPEAKVEGKLPDVEVKAPSIEAEIKAPEIKVETKTKEGSPSKLKMPTFKLPKFGTSIPETEIKVDGAEVTVPQVDVDIPDVKAEVNLPKVEIKASSGEVIVEQPSDLELDAKFKKPRFSLPRFSFSKQSVPAPEVDISGPEGNISQTEGKVEVKGEIDLKAPELDAQIEGQGSKFKLPKFGITMPKISAPEIDLSLSKKDVEGTLPEAKVEGKLPDVEVKAPSIEAEVKAPEIKAETKTKEGSPSKLKMPIFKLPKFGASIPEAEIKIDGADVTVPQVDVDLPEIKAEVHLPEVEVKAPSAEVVTEQPSDLEMDAKFKKPRFSLPRFSFSKQSVPAPEVDIDVPEVNVPEVEKNIEVKVEMDVKSPEFDAQVDGQGSKFKFPKFGIAMPKLSAPEIDLGLSKKDTESTLSDSEVKGKLPSVEIRGPSVEGAIKAPEIKPETKQDSSPSKLKMPSFKMPKFGVTTSSVSAEGVDIKADIPEEVLTVQADSSSVDIKVSQPEGKRSKFKLPSLGFSSPSTDVELPDVEIKNIPAKVDIKTGEMGEGNVEGSPSKFKIPAFKLPKFGSFDGETPEVDINMSNKDVKDEKSEVKEEVKESKGGWSLRKISFSKSSSAAPEIDVKLPKVDVTVSEPKKEMQSPEKKSLSSTVEEQPTPEIDVKLKKPRFSLPKISFGKQPSVETEADVSLPEVDASLSATKMEIKETGGKQKIEDEVDTQGSKFKMPKFGISMPKVKGPEIDISLSKKEANINSPEAKIETTLPDTEDGEVSLEAAQKGSSWSFPRFSFSKPAVNVTVDSEVDVKNDLKEESTPKHEVKKHSVDEDDSPAVEPEIKTKFSLPRFSFSKTSAKEPTIPENAVAVEVSLSEGEVKIKESKVTQPDLKGDAKLSSVGTKDVVVSPPENETKSKDTEGSPSKFKMPVFKMPKIGITTTVTEESSSTSKEIEETLQVTKEGNAVVITAKSPSMDVKTEASVKGPSMEIKTDVPKASTPDPETPQGEALGSPSKWLPTFKMPRLSFSKPKPEDEYTSADIKMEENQQKNDLKEESKSPKKALPSFGDILKNIDVEFDVPNPLDENLGSPREDQAAQKQQEPLKETKHESTKSPEKTGWFKFPTFGLSSPTGETKEAKMSIKTPVDLTGNEELSPTCSIQSSEAFADISSTMTSENIGFSLSSPTKVTVKYSDPDSSALTGEMHSNVVMSTTKTEVFSVEPNLPEKITILSSGLSSSSEDTVQLASGKIHIITSNIQATPETQQPKMMTSVHVQSTEGVSGHESWTVTDSRSSKSTFMESHVVRESSSESKEVVITKQITRVVTTTEPISDETATSIKQLKDSVHTDKMRFFDEAKK